MCDYCEHGKVLLKSNIEVLSNTFGFGCRIEDVIIYKDVYDSLEKESVRVFYDSRGALRLTFGDDIGCLDHSEDTIKINYCPMCGKDLQ